MLKKDLLKLIKSGTTYTNTGFDSRIYKISKFKKLYFLEVEFMGVLNGKNKKMYSDVCNCRDLKTLYRIIKNFEIKY